MHFTATPEILLASKLLKLASIDSMYTVKLLPFTIDLTSRLRTL